MPNSLYVVIVRVPYVCVAVAATDGREHEAAARCPSMRLPFLRYWCAKPTSCRPAASVPAADRCLNEGLP